MAFRATATRLGSEQQTQADIQQSASMLPLQYDSLLALVDPARGGISQDPLAMCIPMFAQAAFSEVQFLNMMDMKIQSQVNRVSEGVPADALSNLQFFSSILGRHSEQIKESLRVFRRLAGSSFYNPFGTRSETVSPAPRGDVHLVSARLTRHQSSDTDSSRLSTATPYQGPFSVEGLLEDLEDLHSRCVALSEMCTRGVTLAMNKATIDESRKAIEQSARLKKLTLLATFFIPLSFCSSLFGMNLDILGQSEVSFWWFFVLCVPITFLAYMMYLWDRNAVVRYWLRCCGFVKILWKCAKVRPQHRPKEKGLEPQSVQ